MKKTKKKAKNRVGIKVSKPLKKQAPSPKHPVTAARKAAVVQSSRKKKKSAVFRVNVDFPHWMVSLLDEHCTRLAVTRQSLIKVLIAKALDEKNGELSS